MSKNRELTRKVLCGLLAAATMGISGTALAADDGYSTSDYNINLVNAPLVADSDVRYAKISTSGTGSLLVRGNVTAVDIDAQGQALLGDADGILINGSVYVNANKLTSSGTINAAGFVRVRGTGSLESTGTVKAKNISFDAANSENNVNNLEATNSIGVYSGNKVIATGKLTSKSLSVNMDASLTAKTVEVTDLSVGGKLSVTDTAKANSFEVVGIDADVTLKNGAEVTKDVTVIEGKLTADGLVTANSIAASDSVALNGGATVAKDINVTGGTFTAGGTVKADTLTIDNNSIQNKVENLDVSTIDVKSGAILASGNVVAGDINANGTFPFPIGLGVTIDRNVIVTGAGSLTSTGTVKAESIEFDAEGITNSVNNLVAGRTINAIAGTVTASGKLTADKLIVNSRASLSAKTVEADEIDAYGKLSVTDTAIANSFEVFGFDADVTLENGAEVNGDINFWEGKLTAGGTVHAKNIDWLLRNDSTVNNLTADETLKIEGNLTASGAVKADTVTLSEATVAVADSGSLEAANMNVDGNSTITGSAAVTEKLTIDDGKVLNVGNDDKAGKLTVNKLTGGTVFLDPAWKVDATDTVENASGLAVADTAVASTLIAGRNSKVALGTTNLSDADTAFNKTGLTWGWSVLGEDRIGAGVYVAGTADVSRGAIVANGYLESYTGPGKTAGTVEFIDDSVLMVDGESTKSKAAITGVTSVYVDDSSKLYIDSAAKNTTYHILAGEGITSDTAAWADNNIITSNSLLKFVGSSSNGAYDVTTGVKSLKDVYGGEVIGQDAYDAALQDSNDNKLANFALAAADSKINSTKAAQISAFSSQSSMNELAGVSHSTYAVSNLLTDAAADHMSLASEKTHDKDVWAKFIHTKEKASNLDVANLGASYDSQYNGFVIGTDFYKKGKGTVGAALTYVDGSINGSNAVSSTRNKAKYYGATIYGSIQNGDSAVIGDITYLHGSHDISQNNSTYKITGDAKSDAFGFGVRAEKSFKAGAGKLVPYAGIRYMHLGTGKYTNSLGMSYDADDVNLWMLPVGVKYSANIKSGNTTFRPVAELGYVWNMGGRRGNQTVAYEGGHNSFSYNVADRGSWLGRLAFEVEQKNITYSLGFEYQKGSSVKSNRWMAGLNIKF